MDDTCLHAKIRAERDLLSDLPYGSQELQELLCSGFLTSLCGLQHGTTRASADQLRAGQVVSSLGRADGPRLRRGHQTFTRYVPVADRYPGEACATYAYRLRSAQRALCGTARRGAAICRGLPGVLLRANVRGAS